MAGRTPFTDKDIENLTEYLATHSTDKGRMGNMLYRDLVANAGGKWPWSQRHSWQSWRDHYKRNSDTYERRIRRFLRAKDSVEDASQPAGSKRKASGSPEQLHDAKRAKPAAATSKPRAEPTLSTNSEDEREQGSQAVSQDSRKAVAKIAVPKVGQAQESGKIPSRTQGPPATVIVKPKPLPIPRKVIDDDPFLSTPPATPPLSPPPPTATRKQPPKYVEGPFRNSLSTGSSNWPPVRRKSQAKVNGSQVGHAQPASQRPVVANAMPSSSKDQLPPGNYKSIDEVIKAPASSQSKATLKHTPASAQSAHGSAKKNPAPIRISPAKPIVRDTQARKDAVDSNEPSGGKKKSRPIPASRSSPRSHEARPLDEGNPEVPPDDEVEEVFTETRLESPPPRERDDEDLRKQLHARRLFDTPADARIPHIDLKEVTASVASRRQSSISSVSRNSSSRSSLAPSVPAPRRDSLVLLDSRRSSLNHAAAIRDMGRFDKAALLTQLGRRYGFDVSVAEKVYERLQDLDKTNVYLSKLRDRCEAAGEELFSELEDGADATREKGGKDGAQGEAIRERKARDDSETTSSLTSLQQLDKSQRRRANGPRHSLTIRPIPPEEVDRYVLTVEEYSPPRRSRAGRYSRKSGSLPKPNIMPYSQTPGALMKNGEQAFSSPPRVDLRYSSSPLKGRKSRDLESLPPSSPPKEQEGGAEDSEDGDEERDEDEDDDDSLEDEYEDLFGGGHRPTSPEEVEQELFSERFDRDEDEDQEQREKDHGDEDEDRYQEDGGDEGDEDQNEDSDSENAMSMNENEGDESDEDEGHIDPVHHEGAPESDTDNNLLDDHAEEYLTQLQIFPRLIPAEQKTQRQLAKLVNTTNLRKNRHAMEEWEARLDPQKKKEHELMLLQTVLERLKEGVEKPVRLDQAYDEALEMYSH